MSGTARGRGITAPLVLATTGQNLEHAKAPRSQNGGPFISAVLPMGKSIFLRGRNTKAKALKTADRTTVTHCKSLFGRFSIMGF